MNTKDTLIYLLRRDLRVADNPILHSLSTQQDHSFTHMLPLYVFNAQQLEVSGFLQEGEKSPYKEARSQVAGFWRCGPHRAKFLAESVWDVKEGLEKIGSGLCIRVGSTSDVIRQFIPHLSGKAGLKVKAIWMVGEDGVEESREERAIRDICTEADLDFKLWNDEKYLIDESVYPTTSSQPTLILSAATFLSTTFRNYRMSSQLIAKQLSLSAIILEQFFPLPRKVLCQDTLLSPQSLLNSSLSRYLIPSQDFSMHL